MSSVVFACDVKSAGKAKSRPSASFVDKRSIMFEHQGDPTAKQAFSDARHSTLWTLPNAQGGFQPLRDRSESPHQSEVAPVVNEVLDSPGRPLDDTTRGFFEGRFRQDFSRVRIHADEKSAEAARSLHSAAFTLGHHIVFARDRYVPFTPNGRLLLLHELRHVQQQQGAVKTTTPKVDLPTSPHEMQARSLFDTSIQPVASQRIQCAPEGDQFVLDGYVVNSAGRAAFGDTSWSFIKAVLEGFVNGLKADVQAGRGEEAKSHLHGLFVPWNAAKFYLGYLVGLVLGLVSPVTDLVKGIIGIIKMAGAALEWLAKWSPLGVAVSPERQRKIAALIQRFGDLAVQFGDAVLEFAKDPKGSAKKFADFLDSMMNLALGQARTMGASAAHSIFDFLKEGYYEMGESIGKVIGGLIAQALLLAFTDAIGNLLSEAANMLGKVADFVAGKVIELIEWMTAFAAKVIGKIREAINGALKLFKGLANSLIDAFEALKALFSESEELASGLKAAPFGGGELGAMRGAPKAMESRMVTSTRTSAAKVEDLKPPKIHPSKMGSMEPAKISGPTTSKLEASASEGSSKAGSEIDVEMGITEEPTSSLPAKRPRPSPPAIRGNASAARGRFEALRDGYARRLGVDSGGQVHHAIELQTLDRYPGVFTEQELNGINNMRGVGPELEGRRQLHNAKIREIWDRHYRHIDSELLKRGLQPGQAGYAQFVKQNLSAARDEIDYVLGQFFTEYRTGRPRAFR